MPSKRRFIGPIVGSKQETTHMSRDGLTPNEADLFRLLKSHDYEAAVALVPMVENINAVDPEIGMTALHWAAAYRVIGLLAVLHERTDLDELALDKDRRSASDLAWVVAEDEELGAALMARERQYANRTGKTPRSEPEPM